MTPTYYATISESCQVVLLGFSQGVGKILEVAAFPLEVTRFIVSLTLLLAFQGVDFTTSPDLVKLNLLKDTGFRNYKVIYKGQICSFLRGSTSLSLDPRGPLLWKRFSAKGPFLTNYFMHGYDSRGRLCILCDLVETVEFYDLLQKEWESRTQFEPKIRFWGSELILAWEAQHKHGLFGIVTEAVRVMSDGHLKVSQPCFFESSDRALNAPEIIRGEKPTILSDFWMFGMTVAEWMCSGMLPFLLQSSDTTVESYQTSMFPAVPPVPNRFQLQFHTYHELGLPPFYDSDPEKNYQNILNKNLDFESDRALQKLSTEAQDLLKKLLQKDPCQRPQSWDEIKNHPFWENPDWQEVAEGKLDPLVIPPPREASVEMAGRH